MHSLSIKFPISNNSPHSIPHHTNSHQFTPPFSPTPTFSHTHLPIKPKSPKPFEKTSILSHFDAEFVVGCGKMDPALIGEGSFSVGDVSVGEIWPFGVSGVVGMRIGSGFGHNGSMVDGFLVNREEPVDGGGSTVTEQSGSFGGEKRKRRDVNEKEGLEMVSAAISGNQNPLKEINSKRIKVSGSSDENGCSKAGVDCSAGSGSKLEDKHDKHEPPKDYVHVRARRGQATDSHSLAERARREKITERMKILQDLVPGCNKVIGKALVLDEIINYVQSLQRQVEFLSMKLDAVNSGIAPAISEFAAKELCPPSFDSPIEQRVPQPEWLHMQLGGGFDRAA